MAIKIYRIGDSSPSGTINLIFNKRRYTESEFWEEFDEQLKVITGGQKSNNLDDTVKQIKDLLNSGNQVTIGNRCFEISSK